MDLSNTPRNRVGLSRRLLLTTLAAGCLLTAGPGCASTPAAGLATLEVYDRDSGQVMPTYLQDGRRYVPGRPGARYALRLRNVGGSRVLVVLSVDGVNVISGQTADWSQTGYVLDPGRWYDINGWRKSDTQVAAFEFAPLEHSYAARTGRPDHVGVIGMAVFREKPQPPAPPVSQAPSMSSRSESRPAAAAPTPAAPANERSASSDSAGEARAAAKLGTGHGQREWSVSRRTAFERASTAPDQLTQIEYDSMDRLVAAGIVPPRWRSGSQPRPQPFPESPISFVPDPPRW